jgi:N-acetylglutamate synthase-like GNAT family acetyltransferase
LVLARKWLFEGEKQAKMMNTNPPLAPASQPDLRFATANQTSTFAAVSGSNYRVRRATLEDIGALTDLWKSMRFPAEELSRRVTEFQVAESADGKLLGALGMQMAEKQGRIHSEGFTDFSLAEQLRPMLWERIQALANNHGLLRLWTKEDAPFWNRCGLAKADEETLAKLPAPWRSEAPNWLTLKLREDVDSLVSLDKEFALFMQSEKERTNRAFQQAKILKMVATLIALALLGLVCVGAFLILRKNPNLLMHR